MYSSCSVLFHHLHVFTPGRLEETEEELVQLKIERETERQRNVKYGTANGAAVAAINSETGGGETGEGGEVGVANSSGGDITDKG